MKTLTFICALKVISNNFNVKKQKRKKDGSEKTEVNVCPHCLLSLLNSWWGKKIKLKKKCTRLAFGALGTNRRYRCIRPPPPTVYAPQHVQTVHYSLLLTGCSWGEGAGSWSSQEVFTSQCTQSSCQLASPAFIRWNSENIPLWWGMLGGVMVQLRTIDTKNLQRGTALQPRAESHHSGEISGRPPPYEFSVSSGSFHY